MLCEIQLRQDELGRMAAAASARGAVGVARDGLGRRKEADLTEKIIQLKTKVHDLDFQTAATALANFNALLGQAKLALQQHSEIQKDPGNSTAQVGFMATYLRAVSGGYNKNEGVTKAEWEVAKTTCPCLLGIEPRFGTDGYMDGATIPDAEATQMLSALRDSAKEALDAYKELRKSVDSQIQEDMEAAGLGNSATPPPNISTLKDSGSAYDSEIMKLLHPKR